MGKKLVSLITAFAVAMTMGTCASVGTAFAEEQQVTAQEDNGEISEAAITVQLNGVDKKTFSVDDLEKIAAEEGNKSYNFSAWNTFPSFDKYENIQGPTVDGILKSAGLTEKDIRDTGTITFTGSDGYARALTGKQFYEYRYYYPNGGLSEHESGTVPDAAYDGSKKVPAVISLDDSLEENKNKTLYVGQVAPNEENNPLFVKKMVGGGVINVSTAEAPRCGSIVVDDKTPSSSLQKEGTEITISPAAGSKIDMNYDKIYYTFEEKYPDYGCPIYNCGPKQEMICKPVCKAGTDPDLPEYKNRKVVLKVKVKGYGKQDSVLQTFTYYVGDALTVKVDGITAKSYATQADLEENFTKETASYSGFNTYPSFSKKADRTGIRVDSIIEDATGLIPRRTLDDDALICFTGTDGYTTKITAGQLFADRYYYPNASAGTDNRGGAVKSAAYEGKELVPSIIETENRNTFFFGQTEPNEQNFAECVDGMLKIAQINIIRNGTLEQCEKVSEAVPEDGSTVCAGQTIELPYPSEKNKRDKICYVIDPKEGETPGLAGGFYNYSAYRYYDRLTNPPVLNKPGKYVIKVKTIGYGKKDSDVTTLNYNVVLCNVTGFKAASSGYNSVTLRWNRTPGATGYEIYRQSGSSNVLIGRINSPTTTSYINSGLKTGTTYYYRIKAVSSDKEGKPVCSSLVTASAKPVPATPSVSLKSGKRKATIKWNRVSGASGYQIYRSLKRTSGFKAVKTIKKGSTKYFVNKKLKKGKTYYYKVRAYKTVSKKKFYGNFSTVKSVKVK
ncbi:MAG: fibronectin type III domain-containing protein [Firmicutes bacterium]|nr:fibronectin type III domain-containing protein [Bacillota bacterium]